MTQPSDINNPLVGALAEGFARAISAPLNTVANTIGAQRIELSEISQTLLRIAVACEGILDRLTPESERERIVQVNAYVRSSNNGGDLVWLYGAHPGLQWKVATVYHEDFAHLQPYLNPAQGKLFDGEVPPTREGAGKKGYLNQVNDFEIVLRPTGKVTDSNQPIYDFKAARAIVANAAQPSSEPPAAQPAQQPANLPGSTPPASGPTADEMFNAMPSASEGRAQGARPAPQAGPRVSGGAGPAPSAAPNPGPQQGATRGGVQATLTGDAFQAFTRWANDFAARFPYYRLPQTDKPHNYRIQCSIHALGERQGKDYSRITLDNLPEIQAAMEAHAAANHPK